MLDLWITIIYMHVTNTFNVIQCEKHKLEVHGKISQSLVKDGREI